MNKYYTARLGLCARLFYAWVLLLVLSTGALPALGQSKKQEASVFITAHQDDWQLFMGSRVFEDAQKGKKVVFIVLTAGQAAGGEDWWRAREAGSVNAAHTAADGQLQAGPASSVTMSIRGNAVTAYPYKNTVAYFLRLPDGGYGQQGYQICSFQTLTKLKNGRGGLNTVDKTNTYASWQELIGTVRAIIQREVNADANLVVHSSNPNSAFNPGDHPEHLLAGLVADDATRGMECRRALYLGYSAGDKPVNLTPKQTAGQSMLFAAYCRGLTDGGQPTAWDPAHLKWLGRQYCWMRHEAAPAAVTKSGAKRLAPRADSTLSVAKELMLSTPAPNPFSFSCQLSYELPSKQYVRLDVYDLHGNLIQHLVEGEQQPGHYETWLDVNRFPASGIYLCRLQAGKEHREQRLQLIR